MKIALNAWFIDRRTTGSGQYLTHLLDEYSARYSNHTFLLCGSQPQSPIPLADCCQWQTLRTPFDRLHDHLAKVWFEQIAFSRAAHRWGADLIHVPYWASPLHAAVPTIVTIHDLIPLLLPEYSGGMLGRLYTRLVAASARRATRVLTDSQASRRDIIQHLRIPAGRIDTTLLAPDAHFAPVTDPDEIDHVRRKYGLPSRYLLYLGGFDVRKNVTGILHAFARLEQTEVKLVLAGKLPAQDTAFFPGPQRIADELGIAGRVHLAGWIDEADKPALYSAALGFVFPSWYEGFGLPPLEAIACGTPAIVSDAGSLPEVVGEAGLCVEAENVEALAEAMEKLVEDSCLRERLCANCAAQAAQFSWARTADLTFAAYRRALAQSAQFGRDKQD